MHRFELVIFDLDGVLADTSPCHRQAYQDTWAVVGINGPEYEKIAGRKTYDVISAYTEHLNPSRGQVIEWVCFKQLQARRYLSTENILYGDTAICLKTLSNLEIKVALGTSASRDSTDVIVKRLGLTPFFSVVVTGDDVRKGKPAPDIYVRAMTLARTPSERTLIIEDSESGLEAATASGAYTASVRTMKPIDHLRFIGCFPGLNEMLTAIGIYAL